MNDSLGCGSVHIHLGQSSEPLRLFQLNWQNGGDHKINGKFCDWTDKENFISGFARFLGKSSKRYFHSEQRLEQTLQLTIRCKAGGNQASLVLQQLLGFLFLLKSHYEKCQ